MKSDLHLLREFGDVLDPPLDQPPADLRRRVLGGALADRARPRKSWVRLAWPLTALGGATAAATIAAIVMAPTIQVAEGPPGPAPQEHTVALDATRILNLAAHRTTARPAVTARPDQFVFVESVEVRRVRRMDLRPTDPDVTRLDGPLQVRRWLSVDGTRDGLERSRPVDSTSDDWRYGPIPGCRDGRESGPADRPGATVPCTPFPAHRPDLPTDPDEMLRYLYRTDGGDEDIYGPGISADQRAFGRVSLVIDASYLAPGIQSAVLRAATRIPGVTVIPNATDVHGRTGVGVARTGDGYRTELVFNAETYEYYGMNEEAVERVKAMPFNPGDVLKKSAIHRVDVVDRTGQVP